VHARAAVPGALRSWRAVPPQHVAPPRGAPAREREVAR
jgi:hypothetical protein